MLARTLFDVHKTGRSNILYCSGCLFSLLVLSEGTLVAKLWSWEWRKPWEMMGKVSGDHIAYFMAGTIRSLFSPRKSDFDMRYHGDARERMFMDSKVQRQFEPRSCAVGKSENTP